MTVRLITAALGGGCFGFVTAWAALQGDWAISILALGIWLAWQNLTAWIVD